MKCNFKKFTVCITTYQSRNQHSAGAGATAGAETWTCRTIDQKYLESFEM